MTRTIALAAILVLAAPAAAQAHHVTGGTAACDASGITATVNFASFSPANKPIAWTTILDGAPSLAGTFTFPGPTGTLNVPAPGLPGSHTIQFDATWPGKKADNNGTVNLTVDCPALPPVVEAPPVVAPAPVVETPAVTVPPVITEPVPAVKAATTKRHAAKKPKVRRCDRRYSRRSHRMVFVCPRKTIIITPKFTG